MALVKIKFTASWEVKTFRERGVLYTDGAVVQVPGWKAENLCKTYPELFSTDIEASSGGERVLPPAATTGEPGSRETEPASSKKKKYKRPKRNKAMRARADK